MAVNKIAHIKFRERCKPPTIAGNFLHRCVKNFDSQQNINIPTEMEPINLRDKAQFGHVPTTKTAVNLDTYAKTPFN